MGAMTRAFIHAVRTNATQSFQSLLSNIRQHIRAIKYDDLQDQSVATNQLLDDADGTLLRSGEPLAALRRVAAGGMHVSPTTAEALASLVSQGRTKSGIEQLSHREHQVYLLLTQGHSVSEIGAQLSLAPNTVSTYRARILEKTGTKNDVELALYAQSISGSQGSTFG